MHAKLFIVGGAIAAVLVMPTSATAAGSRDVHTARAGTEAYHDVDKAQKAGYGLLKDASGMACIDKPGAGAMGIHHVNGSLVGDAVVDAAHPEALVYEPREDGRLQLVALEYIVFQSAWSGHTGAPTLFGRTFELVASPNRYGLPPFYELHAWVWKDNPAGMFSDWNPEVSCENSAAPDLRTARAATETYRRLDTAQTAGYGLLKDAAGIACIAKPGVGTMGVHYVNGALVGDATVDAAHPEALVYEPREDGQPRLVALEYIVFQSAWQKSGHSGVPTLFDRPFELVTSPNRYGLPPFYEIHAWVWDENPSGMFADWNPDVSCTDN